MKKLRVMEMRISIIICLCIWFASLSAQQTDFLIQPAYQSYFTGGQFINESRIRLFGISEQIPYYHGKAFYVDVHADSTGHTAPSLISPDSIGSYAVWRFSFQPFRDGSTMLVFDQQDCDFSPSGEVTMLLPSGEQAWRLPLDYQFYVEDIKILAPDVIGIFFNGDTLYIDREGNMVPYNLTFSYDHVLETDEGYMAANEDTLFTLDADFIPVSSVLTAGKITELQYVSYYSIMVKTEFQFYELNANGEIVDLPFVPDGYRMMVRTDSAYWGLRDRSVEQIDLMQSVVDTFPVSATAELELLTGFSLGNELLIVSRYRSNSKLGFVLFRENPAAITLHIPNDIAITAVLVSDTINATWSSGSLFGGKDFTVETAFVEVTNFGEDTITSFEIEFRYAYGCFFGCAGMPIIWPIDSVQLAPQASTVISLGSTYIECAILSQPLCFVTARPNNRADNVMMNNIDCPTPYFNIITNTQNENLDRQLSVYPNPAVNEFRLSIEPTDASELQINIYSIHGLPEKSLRLSNGNESIDIHELPEGIHMVRIEDQKGRYVMKKLIVQR